MKMEKMVFPTVRFRRKSMIFARDSDVLQFRPILLEQQLVDFEIFPVKNFVNNEHAIDWVTKNNDTPPIPMKLTSAHQYWTRQRARLHVHRSSSSHMQVVNGWPPERTWSRSRKPVEVKVTPEVVEGFVPSSCWNTWLLDVIRLLKVDDMFYSSRERVWTFLAAPEVKRF